MSLPASFQRDGFVGPSQARNRIRLRNGKFLKPLMIGVDGLPDSGKSEFIFSCPDPGICICIDRGIDPCIDNPNPPASRRPNWAVKIIPVPPNTTQRQPVYADYFKDCRDHYYKALANPDALTVAIDGDSDLWELQRLAEFGRLTQVFPQTRYTDVYASRRAMTAKAYDSGKIVIGTNKVKPEYEDVIGADGLPEKDDKGEIKRRKTGRMERQGFPDQDYLWSIQLRCEYQPPRTNAISKKEIPGQFGIRICKCKVNTSLVGAELWGDDANFTGLVQLVYPHLDPQEFGL